MDRRLLKEWIEGMLPLVDVMAGSRAVDSVAGRIYQSMSWQWDEDVALDTAVFVTGKVIEELKGLWARLNTVEQDVLNLPDKKLREQRLLECWMQIKGVDASAEEIRLSKKYPPTLEACRMLFFSRAVQLQEELVVLFMVISNSKAEMSKEGREQLVDFCLEVLGMKVGWRVKKYAARSLRKTDVGIGDLVGILEGIKAPFVIGEVVDLLYERGRDEARKIVRGLMDPENEGSDFIVRRRLLESMVMSGDVDGVIEVLKKDPSVAVRQKAAFLLLQKVRNLKKEVIDLILKDRDCVVSGVWVKVLSKPEGSAAVANALNAGILHLMDLKDENCLFILLRGLAYAMYMPENDMWLGLNTWDLSRLSKAMHGMPNIMSPRVHTWWWLCADLAEILSDQGLFSVYSRLRKRVEETKPGARFRFEEENLENFVKILGVVGAMDFGLYARKGKHGRWILQRGLKNKWKLWRVIDEVRHPAYDKRQAYFHTTGREVYGEWWFPSLVMAEVTKTRVPGEAVYYESFGGPAIPVVGPVLAASGDGTVMAPGVRVEIKTKSWIKRRLASLFRIRRVDESRHNALTEGSGVAVRQYLGEVSGTFGVQLNIESKDGFWERWMGLGAVVMPFAYRNLEYFFNPQGNTIWDLAIFSGLVAMGVFARAWWINHKVRGYRKELPLSIGGWGSRGKSGTERLKAALFNGLGFRVFSKTTGTDAMFLMGVPGLFLTEIPLFRPYGKASIHEQRTCLRQAATGQTDVFLWECMALNPRYVQILSHDWMRDDIATVTNTYPDHEDIQGPTGVDVANTISKFLPEKSRAITMEQQMYPVLAYRARSVGTDLKVVNPAIAWLIPQEYLERMPYLEHPLNVALVLELANELGVDEDEALYLMGTFLVPDIGALKTYPEIREAQRTFSFANTMAANERAGFVASLERLGLLDWDTNDNLIKRTVLVVNNRADRPARSHEFAAAIVQEASVNGIIIIGSAQRHFYQLLMKYLNAYYRESLSLLTGEEDVWRSWLNRVFGPMRIRPLDAVNWDITLGRWLKIDNEQVKEAFGGLAEQIYKEIEGVKRWSSGVFKDLYKGAGRDAKEIIKGLGQDFVSIDEAGEFAGREIVIAGICRYFLDNRVDGEVVIDAAKAIFVDQVYVMPDQQQSPQEIIDAAVRRNPPGSYTRLVGAQNIKGPGLEFVHLWVALEDVKKMVDMLKGDLVQDREVIASLVYYEDYHRYNARIVKEAIDNGRLILDKDNPLHQTLLKHINDALQHRKGSSAGRWMGVIANIAAGMDVLIDPVDSMLRTHRANKVMKLLKAGLIGPLQASGMLHRIMLRQEEGPLSSWIKSK